MQTIKDTPPAELTRCPMAPVGLPTEGEATIPAAWRSAIVRLAKAYRDTSNQLERLIDWNTGERCGAG